jgi:hypothetical protein
MECPHTCGPDTDAFIRPKRRNIVEPDRIMLTCPVTGSLPSRPDPACPRHRRRLLASRHGAIAQRFAFS